MTNIDEDCTQIAKNFKPLNNHKLLYEEGYKKGKEDVIKIIKEKLQIAINLTSRANKQYKQGVEHTIRYIIEKLEEELKALLKNQEVKEE